MGTHTYRTPRQSGNRGVVALAFAVVAVAAIGIGTGMSYAGQNSQGTGRHRTAGPNANCSLVVPAQPLSAQGLATPYELVATDGRQGACHETDRAQAAFVQAGVIDPTTGKVSVYNPLVIDRGTRPKVPPVLPALPKNAVVGIWFGYNGGTLTLRDSHRSLSAGACVNGLGDSLFTQFAYCNAPAFFTAANAAVKTGRLKVPPVGTGKDGNPCPTTRDFTIVDQDQSDNVTTAYLIEGRNVAQDTAGNRARLPHATVQVNGSDNLLLVQFVDQAMGCEPFTAPDLADHGEPASSLALNELQAAADQGKPVAMVPPNDPMTEVHGHLDTAKLNLYRRGVDMPTTTRSARLAALYCQSMVDLQPKRLKQDRTFTERIDSPDPGAANSLFTFLAQRLHGSFDNLGCGKLVTGGNPVKLKTRNGVAVNASFVGPAGTPNGGDGKAAPSPSPSRAAATAKSAVVASAPLPVAEGPATASRIRRSKTTDGPAPNAPGASTKVYSSDTAQSARAADSRVTGIKGGTSRHTQPVISAANGETTAGDYGRPADNGGAIPAKQEPTGAGPEQGKVAAQDEPPVRTSENFPLAGADSTALVIVSIVLPLAAILVMCVIRRRRGRPSPRLGP